MGALWWKNAVIYQIYPRSFADSNGDGIGDLPGIVTRLDYLADLGVDAVWFSPIYPSPDVDFGYDVSDYCAVDPKFGSLEDFDQLVTEAHRRGIRVILDMVLNHTSDQHPWFLESRKSRANPYRNWYLWADPRPGGGPPNNWQSVFGGSGWELDPATGQYYFHMFYKQQPDVNWHNPAVRKALLDVFRFWMERGVDGFRLDVFNVFFKEQNLTDNPVRFPMPLYPFAGQRHSNDFDQPEMIPLLNELRALMDEYSTAGQERYAVGETFLSTAQKAAGYTGPNLLHAAFNFEFLHARWSARRFAEVIERWEHMLGAENWPNYVLNNHDTPRSANRFHSIFQSAEDDGRLKVSAALLLTLRGTPFMYYGEEIGMRDLSIHSKAEVLDPIGKTFWPFMKGRDGCRSPMQWDASPLAGFAPPGARPWLPVYENYPHRNVAAQQAAPNSLFHFYRKLIALRRQTPALLEGMYQPVTFGANYLLAYLRQTSAQTVLVVLNFSRRKQRLVLGGHLARAKMKLLLSSCPKAAPLRRGNLLHVDPLEAAILEIE